MRVIADRAAGTRIQTDDAARLEILLPSLVSAVTKIEQRRGAIFFSEELRERDARSVPLDEHIDRRSFDAFVGLMILRVVARVPRIFGQVLAAMRAEGVECDANVMIGSVGDEERPRFRLSAFPNDGVMSLHAERP